MLPLKRNLSKKEFQVNGLNVLTVEFEKSANRDLIRNRNDEEVAVLEYTDAGEIRSLRALGEEKVPRPVK